MRALAQRSGVPVPSSAIEPVMQAARAPIGAGAGGVIAGPYAFGRLGNRVCARRGDRRCRVKHAYVAHCGQEQCAGPSGPGRQAGWPAIR